MSPEDQSYIQDFLEAFVTFYTSDNYMKTHRKIPKYFSLIFKSKEYPRFTPECLMTLGVLKNDTVDGTYFFTPKYRQEVLLMSGEL